MDYRLFFEDDLLLPNNTQETDDPFGAERNSFSESTTEESDGQLDEHHAENSETDTLSSSPDNDQEVRSSYPSSQESSQEKPSAMVHLGLFSLFDTEDWERPEAASDSSPNCTPPPAKKIKRCSRHGAEE